MATDVCERVKGEQDSTDTTVQRKISAAYTDLSNGRYVLVGWLVGIVNELTPDKRSVSVRAQGTSTEPKHTQNWC